MSVGNPWGVNIVGCVNTVPHGMLTYGRWGTRDVNECVGGWWWGGHAHSTHCCHVLIRTGKHAARLGQHRLAYNALVCCFAGVVSHLVQKGVNWPGAHFSSGMRRAAQPRHCRSAKFVVLCWFCAGLSWSLLDPAGFAVLCWF